MNLRERLRATTVFPDTLPALETTDLPGEPAELFATWLDEAIAAGQAAPHVMTLSTANAQGQVSARNLILKDIDARGWQFATHTTSPKARDVAARPEAALTFFWPVVGRQIRVTGNVAMLPREEAAADFLARPVGPRVATLVGHQSEVLAGRRDLELAHEHAAAILGADPATVDEDWGLYAVEADRVEFWQAAHDRLHTRVLYRRQSAEAADPAGVTWTRETLWP